MIRPPNKFFVYVWGCSGSGKTLYVKQATHARIQAQGRVTIVDPNGVFDGFGQVVTVREAAARLRAADQTGRLVLTVRPAWGEDVGDVFRYIFAAGNMLAVVDEAEDYASDKEFRQLNQRGRNRFVDLATTSQGPVSIPRRLRMNYDAVVVFRQPSPEYALCVAEDYLRKRGAEARVWAERIMALEIEKHPDGRLIRSRYVRITPDGGVTVGWLTP